MNNLLWNSVPEFDLSIHPNKAIWPITKCLSISLASQWGHERRSLGEI